MCERCGNDLRDGFCSLCNLRNSFIYDPNPNSFDCPPDSYHPPHPTYETWSGDSCGNDSNFCYDCQPQFPLNYESEPGYIENYNSYPYDSSSLSQQELCFENCGQYIVNNPIFNAHNDFLDSQNKITIAQTKIMEQMTSLTSMCTMLSACFDDDDDDYAFAITPNEPDNSLSMGDEHLDTIPVTESVEFIKYSVENLVPNPIPSEINETDCYPEEETHFIKRLLYDNSSPRPPEEFVSEYFDAEIESFSPLPIPIEDSDSLMKEIDLSFTSDYPMLSGIEDDDYDSERDVLILDELLSNNSLSLPKNESFHFDIPSFSRPPAKPPDDYHGLLSGFFCCIQKKIIPSDFEEEMKEANEDVGEMEGNFKDFPRDENPLERVLAFGIELAESLKAKNWSIQC
nr:hypothetical protein [Tanacetum cinerariifolium]